MPDHQRITSPAQATRAARAALGAVGLADVRRVTSRTVAKGGRLYGTIRTDVYLAAHHDRDAIADVLRTLPGTVSVDAEETRVCAYRITATGGSVDTLESGIPR
ncbi:hypothetical protein [Polymorphospora rubra]|uniref:Uncharacterized protein n=1 Tax=Polymorphospora rubra TaxID=338584 RepID=A0A810MW99_9ACTN|nr:hypothetical protein [Polymorphospora rubra]BCJ64830.1 hypothetical protein Prubr_18510 [Polymorphospora rubra]